MLLLGGSMGGELLNPAAVEVAAISKVTKVDNLEIIRQIMPYNLLACTAALLVFWWLAVRYERQPHALTDEAVPGAGHAESIAASMAAAAGPVEVDRINPFKAVVPLVPIILLMFVKPWLANHGWMPTFDEKVKEQAPIAAAMLIGTICAALATGSRAGKIATAFFAGAGFAYVHVISVIICANVFSRSIEVNGLIDMMANSVKNAPTMVMVASVVVPWLMAAITGTAVGTAPVVIGILLPVAMKTVDPSIAAVHGVRTGGASAITAQFGRTSSPVAPVVIMCSTLAQSRPLTLVKRVLLPLLVGGGVLLVAALARLF
jgi:DcuC family C4-dicarboxylate transporter